MNVNTCIHFHIMENEEKFAAVARKLRKAKIENRIITEKFVFSVFEEFDFSPDLLENWQIHELHRIIAPLSIS